MSRILSIQYLRALAAISVAVFHEAESYGGWFPVGGAGVDLFFVISGFIMFVVTEEAESVPKTFLWRRLIRIAPLYWAVTLLTVLICLLHPHLLWGVDIHFNHIVPSLLFIPHINMMGKNGPTLLQGWTLNIEMFFYAVLTVALFFQRHIQLYLVSAFLAGMVVLGAYIHPQTALLKAYTDGLLLEFIAGMWLGYFWTIKTLCCRAAGFVLLAFGLIVLCSVQWVGLHGGAFRPVYWGIPAFCLVYGALAIERDGGVLHLPFLKTLGDASYSIYLLHGIVESVVNRFLLPLFLKVPLAVALAAFFGVVTFVWIERPVTTWLRKAPALNSAKDCPRMDTNKHE